MSDQFNSDATVEHMTRVYGSRFAACPCGREAVLLYRRTQEGETLNDVRLSLCAARVVVGDPGPDVRGAHDDDRGLVSRVAALWTVTGYLLCVAILTFDGARILARLLW